METTETHKVIPLQFQLLYNWEVESTQEALLKHKTRMYSAFKVELNQIPIYRLIHYEFERHFISAGQLFKASGLTLTEGFFLFGLKPADFEVDFLISQFPYCDIWVSIEQARSMAMALGVDYELSLLLSEELDDCFSSDNISRNEIMHNWIVPSIPTLQYSTRALLEATFDEIQLLDPLNRKIRTQISRSKQAGMVMKDRTETGLVRWQVWAYDQFLQVNDEQEEESSVQLDRTGAVWDTLQGILTDLQTMSRGPQAKRARVLSDNMMVGNMPLKKEYLGHSLPLQQLYIAVMAEKIVNELSQTSLPPNASTHRPTEEEEDELEERLRSNSSLSVPEGEKVNGISTETTNTSTTSHHHQQQQEGRHTNMLFHDRMDLLEQELYRVKKRSKKKLEDIQVYQDEMAQQLNELISWKSQSIQARKSERVWMLMLMFCITFGAISLRTFFL